MDMGRIFDDNTKRCDCSPGYYEFYKKCIRIFYYIINY